jgi:putative aldouronate transport system substrate-binding protein
LKKMKKLWIAMSLTLAVVLTLSACSSGGNGNGSNQGNSTKNEGGSTNSSTDKGPVVLDTFISVGPRIEDINTNTVTKHLEETTNVKFKFEATPDANADDKRKLIMASGDYPAVFLSGNFSQTEQIDFGQQGVLLPLNDLIEQYGNEIKRAFDEDPDLKTAITAPDGNIYALPSINDCFHCWYSQKMWINKAWLDKLNLDIPTTTEEFYNVLKAFKTQDPNGNGKADEIPLTGAYGTWHGLPYHFLMNSFAYDDEDKYFSMNNGKVGLSAITPEWRQGLEYVNKLYAEGLVDMEAFTQNNDALTQIGNREGDNIIGATTVGHIGMAFNVYEGQTRHKDYVSLAPLTGPNGIAYAGVFKGYGGGTFAITNKATQEQQIAAIKLADYMWSEEFAVINEYGLKGRYWEDAPAGENNVHGNQAKYKLTPAFFEIGSTLNDHWDQMGITRRTRDIRESWVAPSDPMTEEGFEYRLFLETKNNYENREPKEVYPPTIFLDVDKAKEINMMKPLIKDYIESNMAQFITGSKKLTDDEWNKYVKGFDGLNLTTFLQYYQEAYDRTAK